jgi:hypothetical protein
MNPMVLTVMVSVSSQYQVEEMGAGFSRHGVQEVRCAHRLITTRCPSEFAAPVARGSVGTGFRRYGVLPRPSPEPPDSPEH